MPCTGAGRGRGRTTLHVAWRREVLRRRPAVRPAPTPRSLPDGRPCACRRGRAGVRRPTSGYEPVGGIAVGHGATPTSPRRTRRASGTAAARTRWSAGTGTGDPLGRPAARRQRRRPQPHLDDRPAGRARGASAAATCGPTCRAATPSSTTTARPAELERAVGGGAGRARAAGAGDGAHRGGARRVVEASPWYDLDPKHFHVAFLSGDPDPAKVAAIDHEALLPERVVVGERVLYLDYALGAGRSTGLDRLRLGVDATARNWRTVHARLQRSRRRS